MTSGHLGQKVGNVCRESGLKRLGYVVVSVAIPAEPCGENKKR